VFGLLTQAILALAAAAAFLLLGLQTRRLRQARAETAASRAALLEMEVIYDQAPLGLTVLDRELRYLRTNRMLAEQNGLTVEAHLGKSIHEIVPEIAASAGPMFMEVIDNGDVLHVLMHAVPLRGQDGDLIGSAAAFVDITAQRKAAQELERQARHKDEFLAVLAHELRNPLAAIQGGLELLKMDGLDYARQARTHEILQRQMTHVVRLIDDLLDVARISSGKLELKVETAGVREIAEAAIELCRGEIERGGGHRFHAGFPPGPLYVQADRVRLTEVISNLLHNAAKYTPAGGRIGLSVSQEQGQAVFRVTDNGIGIAQENLGYVFTMFGQSERARAHRQGGLGVGLALARRIVELHGGAIAAESDGPVREARFPCAWPLPRARPPARPSSRRDARQRRRRCAS
jgi:signal transduction histidine kinase